MILQPFAENAIWHGIAPKESQGKISIQLQMDETENFLDVQMIDDGVGLQATAQKRNIHHQSKGIHITRERLGKHGKITIFDRKGMDQTGVQVDLQIPIINDD